MHFLSRSRRVFRWRVGLHPWLSSIHIGKMAVGFYHRFEYGWMGCDKRVVVIEDITLDNEFCRAAVPASLFLISLCSYRRCRRGQCGRHWHRWAGCGFDHGRHHDIRWFELVLYITHWCFLEIARHAGSCRWGVIAARILGWEESLPITLVRRSLETARY